MKRKRPAGLAGRVASGGGSAQKMAYSGVFSPERIAAARAATLGSAR